MHQVDSMSNGELADATEAALSALRSCLPNELPEHHAVLTPLLAAQRQRASEAHFSKLRVLDLFSGIGGFSLGLERTGGFETVAFCEIEDYPRKVLAKHWPGVPIYDDVRTLTAERLARDGIGRIDVITGGFPCQDISVAGKQAGIGERRSVA